MNAINFNVFQICLLSIAGICTLILVYLSLMIARDPAGRADDGGTANDSKCDRSGWKWVQLYGPCWNSLIKLQATWATSIYVWIDFTVIIGYALMLLCSVTLLLYQCTKISNKYPMERFHQTAFAIAIIGIVIMLMVYLKSCFFLLLYVSSARSGQADVISSQLSKSLLQYGHDDNITRAWQNTMREGCCCGLHGYQDFTNIGMDVPPHCGCYDEEEQPYLYKRCTRVTRQYNSDCTAALNTKFTNAGCLSFVEKKVDSSTKYVAEVQLFSVIVAAVGVLLISALLCDNCESTKRHIPQNKSESKTVYSFKGSLAKKLVCIILRAMIIYYLIL